MFSHNKYKLCNLSITILILFFNRMRQMLKKEKSISFGKNDPDILQSQTPCKKLFSSNTQMDDVGQEKLGSFQLSSSKLCKHIKEE